MTFTQFHVTSADRLSPTMRGKIVWAMGLVLDLRQSPPLRRPATMLNAMVEHFACETADATVFERSRTGRLQIVGRYQSNRPERSIESSGVLKSEVVVPGRRRSARIELRRSGSTLDDAAADWLDVVHRGCAFVYGLKPTFAGEREALSPRVRHTLEHLLRGASEKQVAALLQRSRHTIHAYVKSLYRHFGVSSRAELLARFVERDT